MTDPATAAQYAGPTSQFGPVDWIEITPSADKLARPLRALRADTACTVTVKTAASGDTEREMKFLAGETRQCIITHVIDVSAGAVEGGI